MLSDSHAAIYAAPAKAVEAPTNAPAATVDAQVVAATPFATAVTAVMAAAAPPAVATTATAHTATTATAATQPHQESPLESVRDAGLLPQYANML